MVFPYRILNSKKKKNQEFVLRFGACCYNEYLKMWKWLWNWVTGKGWKNFEAVIKKKPRLP